MKPRRKHYKTKLGWITFHGRAVHTNRLKLLLRKNGKTNLTLHLLETLC